MTGACALHARGASFRYAGSSSATGPFDLAARAGELHLVTAPSGGGKSTLARLLAGAIPHLYRGDLGGRVLIGGEPSDALPLWQLAQRVGLVGQNPAAQLLGSTVRDEIVFGLETLGLPEDEISARAEDALAGFGLRGLARRAPHTLSGGEQQRLVLAAIAARRPPAIVLDEPLSMLDAGSARSVVAHLDQLRSAGAALVVFEHREDAFRGLDGVIRRELGGTILDEEPVPPLPARVPRFRIAVEGLRVELGGRAILDGIDLDLSGGRVISIVGDNGAGKTTLLRTLAGLQHHAGRISREIHGSPGPARLGLCFQNPDCQLFNPTVREEVRYAVPQLDERHTRAVLELLGLAGYESTPPLLLSEGEKKRLGLAITLLQPDLCGICLDEPTLGQDAAHRRRIGRVARRLAEAGHLCLIATHDLEWARTWSDEVARLAGGRLVADEPTSQRAGHRDPSAAGGAMSRAAAASAPCIAPLAPSFATTGDRAGGVAGRRASLATPGLGHRADRGAEQREGRRRRWRGGRRRGAGEIVERSPLRRADARTKLALSLAASLSVMLPLPQLVVFVAAFGTLLVAARLTAQAAVPLRRLAPLLAVLLVADCLLVGPSFALLIALRLALMATAFSVLVASTTPDELRGALEALRVPHRLAFTLSSAFRSMALLDRDWLGIVEAQRARGLPRPTADAAGRRRWLARLVETRGLVVPAIVIATRRAWCVHEAAAARGFGSPLRRPRRTPRLASIDHALLAAAASLLLVLWAWR